MGIGPRRIRHMETSGGRVVNRSGPVTLTDRDTFLHMSLPRLQDQGRDSFTCRRRVSSGITEPGRKPTIVMVVEKPKDGRRGG